MSDLEVKHPEFAKRLTDLMDEKDIDRNALSDATGVSYEMIRRYSEGVAKPRSKKMKLISDALGSTAAFLEYGEGDKDKPSMIKPKALGDRLLGLSIHLIASSIVTGITSAKLPAATQLITGI